MECKQTEAPYVCRLYVHIKTEKVMPHTMLACCSMDETKEGMSHFSLSALSPTLFKLYRTPFDLVYIELSYLHLRFVNMCQRRKEKISSSACQYSKDVKKQTQTI